MEKVKIPEPISGGLILSYQCTAECQHCMYGCSPKWKGWISEDDLEKILNGLAGKIKPSPYGPERVSLNYGLHFTGGEPFLNFELSLKGVEIANQLRIPSTFVETNCYWCTNDLVTRERLEVLKGKGLRGILISVNPYYLEYVPFERTERGIRVSQEVFGEKNLMVYQEDYYRAFIYLAQKKKFDKKKILPLEKYLEIAKYEDLAKRVEMFLMGRAVYKLKHLYPKYRPDYFFDQLCQPPFLRDWHNHFDNYGNFLPGYCGGISLGDCQNLDQILKEGIDLEKKPILRFIIKEDFEGLFRFAKDFGYQEPEEGYVSKCHLCVDIRKHLLVKGEFEELQPKEFYSHLE